MSNILEQLGQEVPVADISSLSDGAKYIKIDRCEEILDELFDRWSTQNFNYYLYKGEGYGNLGVAASIELVVEYHELTGLLRTRTFVGACNFTLKSIHPNTHFLATAKSECVKNAMSDMGRRTGRGLNSEIIPDKTNAKEANEGVDLPTDFSTVKLKTNATKIKNK